MTAPMYENWPDDAFSFMSGLPHQLLVGLPDRGAGIVQCCTACGRQVWFGGRDLCRLFPAWLTRDVWAWAMAMRCDDCPSRRQAFSSRRDPAADGFNRGPQDPSDAQRVRRLATWLPDGGLRLDDVAYLVRANGVELRAGGLDQDTILLFCSADSADHYRPTRRPSEPAARAAPTI